MAMLNNQRVNTSYIVSIPPSLGLKNSIKTHSAAVKKQENSKEEDMEGIDTAGMYEL